MDPSSFSLPNNSTYCTQKGKRVDGCWVFGGVERLVPNSDNPFQEESFDGEKCRLGDMFAVIVEKRDARTLIPILRRFVRPGSIVISDMWKACNRIEEIHEDNWHICEHESVNHSVCFKDPAAGAHTDACEGSWHTQCKRMIPNQAHNKNALQGHLFERAWKRKHRKNLWENMWRVLSEVRFENQIGSLQTKPLKDAAAQTALE